MPTNGPVFSSRVRFTHRSIREVFHLIRLGQLINWQITSLPIHLSPHRSNARLTGLSRAPSSPMATSYHPDQLRPCMTPSRASMAIKWAHGKGPGIAPRPSRFEQHSNTVELPCHLLSGASPLDRFANLATASAPDHDVADQSRYEPMTAFRG